MSKLKIQSEGPPLVRVPENDHHYRVKRDRTIFDRLIIWIAYLFAPLGFLLTMIRFATTHYKNERKSINFKLLYHVFMGAFMELALLFVLMTYKGDFKWFILLIILVMLYVIFVLPARNFSSQSTLVYGRFEFLCKSYLKLINVDNVRHIGNIADTVKESEADVRRDLRYLIDWGMLAPDIVYYEGRVKLLGKQPSNLGHPDQALPQSTLESQSRSTSEQQITWEQTSLRSKDKSPRQLPKSIGCPSCGAKNRVLPGQDKICDYCGTTIPYS
ncbi:hypothetical protein MHB77_14200 [Paenibacillus sp. FSL K6-3166]|uniref:hypothetical protein n=1 Tax=unclassified Paenibacillus TaxID=185978 RepID=UPI000B9FC814|nr:hypothetical protein [Paenibacillus sp. VTT E-133291]OZQ77520.1 hypothetical protein CA598_29795 [Paenibacillus sp. VTT E-133291]